MSEGFAGIDGAPQRAAGVDRACTAAVSRAIDGRAIEEQGIPGIVLMKRAGRAAFDLLRSRWPEASRLCICCGRGNNAGDGYVIAGLARAARLDVRLLQLGDADALGGDAARARDWALAEGVEITALEAGETFDADVIVDALLGTGITGAPREAFAAAIDGMNAAQAPVLAVDLPSGLDADTGSAPGAVVQAAATVTFIAAKRGLLTGRGPDLAGALHFDGLGVPAACFEAPPEPWIEVLQPGRGSMVLPRRPRDAHKGAHGHVLVVGGDHGMGGAVALAAEAALRSGAGLVSVATRPAHVPALLARTPEVMAHGVEAHGELTPLLERASVVVLGPGLGTEPWGEMHFDQALGRARERGIPCVVDADGLNLLAARAPDGGADAGAEGMVLTPHPGEAARLLATDTARVNGDRFAAVSALREHFGAIALLKGAGSLIAGPSGVALCPFGNPGMASGGMGDTLAGIAGGLLAQGAAFGEDPAAAAERAVRLACLLHGLAADVSVRRGGEAGLVASDLAPRVAELIEALTL